MKNLDEAIQGNERGPAGKDVLAQRVLSELFDYDARKYLNELGRLVQDTANDDNASLRRVAEYADVPEAVTPDRVRAYIQATWHPDYAPEYAVASALAVLGAKTRALCTSFSHDLKYPSIVSNVRGGGYTWATHYGSDRGGASVDVPGLIISQFSPDQRYRIQLERLHVYSEAYYRHYVGQTPKPSIINQPSLEDEGKLKEGASVDSSPYLHPYRCVNDLIALGFVSEERLVSSACNHGADRTVDAFLFGLKHPDYMKPHIQGRLLNTVDGLDVLYDLASEVYPGLYEDTENKNGQLIQNLSRIKSLTTEPYRRPIFSVLMEDLYNLSEGNASPFTAFGRDNAQALMGILEYTNFSSGTPTQTSYEEVFLPIYRFERHLARLNRAWSKVSSIPMNPPVLEHRGAVLDKYGKITPAFITRMFRQQAVEMRNELMGELTTLPAYADDEREEYTRLMCGGIEGGMSMTGTGRVEWDFWQEMSRRMAIDLDKVQEVKQAGDDEREESRSAVASRTRGLVHIDSGASLGLVDLEIHKDPRAGANLLAGRVAKVVAVDRFPEEQTLNRVYQFNEEPGHYDQTMRLLSVDEARNVYQKAQAGFYATHPSAEFVHITADSTQPEVFGKLAEQGVEPGQVTLFTDMRANYLHGRPEDREKAFATAEKLLAEGGRAYMQRGLAIYGDLVLGVVYKKINGKMVVEGLQLNKQGKSKTIWRLTPEGNISPTWEQELKVVFDEG